MTSDQIFEKRFALLEQQANSVQKSADWMVTVFNILGIMIGAGGVGVAIWFANGLREGKENAAREIESKLNATIDSHIQSALAATQQRIDALNAVMDREMVIPKTQVLFYKSTNADTSMITKMLAGRGFEVKNQMQAAIPNGHVILLDTRLPDADLRQLLSGFQAVYPPETPLVLYIPNTPNSPWPKDPLVQYFVYTTPAQTLITVLQHVTNSAYLHAANSRTP